MGTSVTKNNIHIEDSFRYPKSEMIPHLEALEIDHPECEVFKRTMFSLKCEWIVHNALYGLGLWKERTKDVDLDVNADGREWAYIVCGVLCWIFVK